MTFEWGEKPTSRSTTSQDASYVGRYFAAGTSSSSFVKQYALAVTPAEVQTLEGTLYRNDIQINPGEGGNIWDVDIFYGRVNRQAGSYFIRWEGSAGSERRFTSLETVASYPAGAPSYGGLIGVDEDRIEGAEFPSPSSMIVVEFKHPQGFFTPGYASVVEALLGYANSTWFFGRPPGEIMLWNFRGSEGSDVDTNIEYTLIRKRNRENFSVGPITGITKRGHDHDWYRYREAVSEGRAVRVPQFAYVERLTEYVDLAGILGFGS